MSVPDPVELLKAWVALEVLQPQVFKRQEDLLADQDQTVRADGKPPSRLKVDFGLKNAVMPWHAPWGNRDFLGLEESQKITWQVPVGFIKVKAATEEMIKKIEPDGPERETTEGVAILALISFDEKGNPLRGGSILSSFGWGCSEVLAGRIDSLHRFFDVEYDILYDIVEAMIERADDQTRVPTGVSGFKAGMRVLLDRLGLDKGLLETPRYAIRDISGTEKEPAADIVNSFYLQDLHRVRCALEAGEGGKALMACLGPGRPQQRRNLLKDKSVLEELLAPRLFPAARWPARKPSRLVTLQQAAVNAAFRDLPDGGLLSVNGPPGTGKTTLLRDVVAGVILERADAMLAFDHPIEAFRKIDLVAENGTARAVYQLSETLRGRGILVASSNNAAVRNVSAELPQRTAIDDGISLRHFAATADHALKKPGSCWGLASAVLGSRANRIDFVESVWWHPDVGLERYFAALGGSLKRDPVTNAYPPVVEREKPPMTRQAALEAWRRARLAYQECRAEVTRLQADRTLIRDRLAAGAADQQAAENAVLAHAEALAALKSATETRKAAEDLLPGFESRVMQTGRLIEASMAERGGPIWRLTRAGRDWEQRHRDFLDQAAAAIRARDEALHQVKAAQQREVAASMAAAAAEAETLAARRRLQDLSVAEAECREIYREAQPGPSFWGGGHQTIHAASPWMDDAFTAARDRMFVAAMDLHRAFMDAAGRAMRSNLFLFMDHLKGKRIPSGAAQYLPDLWDTFFMLTPVASTTFASLGRLLDGLGQEMLGWLIVDEAGQATPQQAVGGLYRAKRVLVIGDPLQIPPVSEVPVGLVRAIMTTHGAHPDLWSAPRASLQTLADAASPLMATVGAGEEAREVGIPLLVHRRCQDPMFTIANEIAYDGLMVQAVRPGYSPIAAALSAELPQSAWINVDSSAAKWSPAEGQVVVELLRRLSQRGVSAPDLYIISPFRDVADRLREHVGKSGVLSLLGLTPRQQKDWGKERIGTVHTFQGKEADTVLVVLGASAEESRGSRGWAGGTPNILNVAATRARQALYIIGHYDRWADVGVFATAARMMPVVNWPTRHPTPAHATSAETAAD
jgi:hypothetical protein